MQKKNLIRLLTETEYRPIKISHNVAKNIYTVLEYIQGKGNKLVRVDHGSGLKHECVAIVKSLEVSDTKYLHVN